MLPKAKVHFQTYFLQSSLKALAMAPAGTPSSCLFSIIKCDRMAFAKSSASLQLPDVPEVHLSPFSPQSCHRIITVGKDLHNPQVQHQPIPPCPPPTSLSARSPQLWNTPRDGDLPLRGQLCHCITTLLEKGFSRIPNLTLPWHNMRPSPLILLLSPRSRGRTPLNTTSFQEL